MARRRRRKRRRGLKRLGRGLKRIGRGVAKAVGRPALNVASSLVPGGAVALSAARSVQSGLRGSRSSSGRSPSVANSNAGVAAEILADANGFLSWLRSRSELEAIPILMQFIASGGASLPGQLSALWGQYLAFKSQTSMTVPSVPGLGPGLGGPQPPVVTNPGTGTLDPWQALYMPITMQPTAQVINRAPKGYVLITHPVTGQKIAVLKEVARRLRLWKPRPKPPISAAEYRQLKTAERVERKLKRLTQNAGYVVRSRKSA